MDVHGNLGKVFSLALEEFQAAVLRENARPIGSPPLRELPIYERGQPKPPEYLIYNMECLQKMHMYNVHSMTVADAAAALVAVPTAEKQYGFGQWTSAMREHIMPSIIAMFHAVGVKPYFETRVTVWGDADDGAWIECAVQCYYPVVAAV